MSKHTPALTVGRKLCYECECDWDRKGNVRAIVLCPLHAAAPELLAALERLEQFAEGFVCPESVGEYGKHSPTEPCNDDNPFVAKTCNQARAAIAKVTG